MPTVPTRARLLVSLSLLGLSAADALAQQPPVPLAPVVVTATRSERSLDEVPQAVQVIDRAEIDAQLKAAANASGALAKLVPGFSVSNQTISGASESFRGRDLLIMIDGVPLNTPLRDVSRLLALIDLNTVERIEVVAGASSLYGSGATGGTVNFITRKGAEGAVNVSLGTKLRAFTAKPGQSLAPEATATVSGTIPDFDYSVTATGRFADKTYDGKGRELPSDGMLGQGGGDRYGQGNLSGKVGYAIDPARRVELRGTWIYLNQEPDWQTLYTAPHARPDFTTPYEGESVLEDTKSVSATYSDRKFTLGSLTVVGFFNDVEKRFNHSTVSAANNLVFYSGNPARPTSPYNQTTLTSRRLGLNATVDTPLDALYSGLKLTWGADIGRENTEQTYGDGSQAFTPLTQATYAAFAQLQAPIGERLTVRGGMRYEYFDLSVDGYTRPAVYAVGLTPAPVIFRPVKVLGGDFSYNSPTFNLGATYRLTDTVDLFAGFSQGFALSDIGAFTRRAGLAAAYLNGGTISYANIAPDTQLVDNYELGLRGALGPRVRGSLTGFVSKSKSGVTFDAASNRLSQQKEIIYGIELTGEVDVTEALTLGGNLSWREGKYDRDKNGKVDTDLPNNRIASPYRGLLYATYSFDGGTVLRLEQEGWTGRKAFDGRVTNRTKGATLTNVSVSHPLFGGEGFVGVSNLFDLDYEVPTATATRNLPVNGWGRTVSLGYQVRF